MQTSNVVHYMSGVAHRCLLFNRLLSFTCVVKCVIDPPLYKFLSLTIFLIAGKHCLNYDRDAAIIMTFASCLRSRSTCNDIYIIIQRVFMELWWQAPTQGKTDLISLPHIRRAQDTHILDTFAVEFCVSGYYQPFSGWVTAFRHPGPMWSW